MTDDEHDGWQHKVNMLRGEINALKRSINSLAATAYDAAKADPPYMPAVIERLERILTLTK